MKPAAESAEGFEIRPYRSGDEEAILLGFARAFPMRRSMERWRAIYQEAPEGARIMVGWAPTGEVAAHYAATAHRGLLGDAAVLTGHVRDVFSVPKYRSVRGGRLGVFVETGRAFYNTWGRDFCCLYGFPSRRSFRMGQLLLGYTPFSRWQAWGLSLEGRPSAHPAPAGIVREMASFNELFDDLWRRRKARVRLAVVRDSRFLGWRFGRAPGWPYWVWTFASYLASAILGYVVLRPQSDKALLVDLCLPEDPRLASSFWWQVAEKLGWRGVRAVETWLSPSAPDLLALQALGFREVPTRPDLVPCFITFQPHLSPAWIDENFYFNMADSDLC